MKWLLLLLVFQNDPSGKPGPITAGQKLFADEASCTLAGERAKADFPKEINAIATCIPQSAFNGAVAQTNMLGGREIPPSPAPDSAPAAPQKGQ